MVIPVKTSSGEYDIILERGSVSKIGSFVPLERKVLIITDDGVPMEYADSVKAACKEPLVITIPQGEISKNLDNFVFLLKTHLLS